MFTARKEMDERAVSRDWDNRQYSKDLQFNLYGLVNFLNRFETATRLRIAELDTKLTKIERYMDFIQLAVHEAADDVVSHQQQQQQKQQVDVSISTSVAGDGIHYPQEGSLVTVSYVGYLSSDASILEQHLPNDPATIVVGEHAVIQGLERAISRMTLGQQARVTIPSAFAYGEAGVDGRIPPDETLIYDIFIHFIE